MSKPNGFVFYKGPSMLDGKPIIAILTGLQAGSANDKTGKMLQTWILREDVNPIAAVNSGDDVSICGDCKHRGIVIDGRNKGRSCYVRLDTAPNNIWKTYHRGRYPHVTMSVMLDLLEGRKVRGGSYGDPAAVPYSIWGVMGELLKTAYTHQWRTFPELAAFCMASVDDETERAQAKLLGFRTFRVRGKDEPIADYEVNCPMSAEMGYKAQCFDCMACGGNNAKAKADITIIVHANKDKMFDNARAL